MGCITRNVKRPTRVCRTCRPATGNRTTRRGNGPLPPCRVTNTSKEIYESQGREYPASEKGEWVEYTQVPDPEKGNMHQQVTRTWLEGLSDNKIDVADTSYWFSTPQEGWKTERVFTEYSPEADVEFADARHFGEGRTSIDDLEEGQVLVGEVTDQWLYHGAEVDIGAQFDGLLPISEEEWADVKEQLYPGAQVKVQVHKLRKPANLWRWPVQLTILEPAGLQQQLCDPDEWVPAIDARGWEPEAILALTGREYETVRYYMQTPVEEGAENVQQIYGEDEPDMDELLEPEDQVTLAYWNNHIAQEMVLDVVQNVY